MTKRQREEWRNRASVILVIAVVFVMTVILLFANEPEQVVVRSSDAVVLVEGMTRAQGGVVVEPIESPLLMFEGSVTDVYEVRFVETGHLEQAFVEVQVESSAYPLSELAVWSFDSSLLAWDMLATSFDLASGTVRADVDVVNSLLILVAPRDLL